MQGVMRRQMPLCSRVRVLVWGASPFFCFNTGKSNCLQQQWKNISSALQTRSSSSSYRLLCDSPPVAVSMRAILHDMRCCSSEAFPHAGQNEGLSSFASDTDSEQYYSDVGDDKPAPDVVKQEDVVNIDLVTSTCTLLEASEWGAEMEQKLHAISQLITPDLIIDVVRLMENRCTALKFLFWALELENCDQQQAVLAKVVGRLGRERDFANAWRVVVWMNKQGLDANYAFSIFLHRLKRAKRISGIVKAMNSLESLNVNPTIPLYTAALDSLLKRKHIEKAQKLYKQMLQSGLHADKKLYEMMIIGFCKAGVPDEAVPYFDEMETQGHDISSSVYTFFISSFVQGGKIALARNFYLKMINKGVLPKVFTHYEFTCALDGQDMRKCINTLLGLVQMLPTSLRIHTCHNLIQYLLEKSKCDEAIAVFHRIPDSKSRQIAGRGSTMLVTGCQKSLTTYTILFDGLLKQGCLGYAVEILREISSGGHVPSNDVYSHLLLTLSGAGMMDEALVLSNHIITFKVQINADAQRSFFSALRASNCLGQACKIFSAMRRKGCIGEDSDFVSLVGLEGK